jgi:hypothetical protein
MGCSSGVAEGLMWRAGLVAVFQGKHGDLFISSFVAERLMDICNQHATWDKELLQLSFTFDPFLLVSLLASFRSCFFAACSHSNIL